MGTGVRLNPLALDVAPGNFFFGADQTKNDI